jgi:MFS family permease
MILSERSRTISALGVVMIFSWGSTYYLLAVLAEPIRADTGWSRGLVTAGISLGLLVSAVVAPRIGALIQREGGRRVLTGGMALIAAGLTLLAVAPNPAVYLGAWLILGLGMGAGLYDAAFSTLGRLYGRDARRAITALTLWGGLASTVCWPITAALAETVGWRGTCLAYAGLHLFVTIPLCLFAVPRATMRPRPAVGRGFGVNGGSLHDVRYWCLVIAGTTLAMLASLWSVHLITILTAQGVGLAAAVALGTLIGPAQVGARVLEMASGARHHPIWTGATAGVLVTLGFFGLITGMPAAAALIAYGAGNGLWSIARGAMPLAIFGPSDYARIMGRLAAPALFASAAAPLIGSWLISSVGPDGALSVMVAAALVPCTAILALWLLRRRSGLEATEEDSSHEAT